MMAINIANSRVLGAGFLTNTPIIYQMYAPNSNFHPGGRTVSISRCWGQHGYIGLILYSAVLGADYRTGRLMKYAVGSSRISNGPRSVRWSVSLIGFGWAAPS